jgi:cob(I)alamin adenosyltransferase
MSIVTGSGDDGSSALFGGRRVPKHHPRLEAYGSVDEAQSAIGMVRAAGEIPDKLDKLLARLQRELFIVGADLAAPDPETKAQRVSSVMIKDLEAECAALESFLPALSNFVMPYGTLPAATCFWARTVVRRSERRIAGLMSDGPRLDGEQDVSTVLVYLNRLGDLLFLVARALNRTAAVKEETWSGKG